MFLNISIVLEMPRLKAVQFAPPQNNDDIDWAA
jgi:hypothetical protein